MRVFISHSSKDKPAVEQLAVALRAKGIDPWLDKWEIGLGDDIVAKINQGLDEAGAGLIIFSKHSRESRWVEAEVSYLTYARIQEGKTLIPVVLGDDAWVPPLLRPLARRGIEEVEAIADALLSRRMKPGPPPSPERGRVERVLVSLRRSGEVGLGVNVCIGGHEVAHASFDALPRPLLTAWESFLRGFRSGVHRDHAAAERTAYESSLADLGRALRSICLPGDAGEALAGLIGGCGIGTTVEMCFEADDPVLLGLPFEALRLPDDTLLVMQRQVTMLRRPAGLRAQPHEPLAGPIKILVAVGAPDEEQADTPVLDQERELQSILDAVEGAQRHENVEVRILEVGHPKVIGAAMERDVYHVLHLSCHGGPGNLQLEDEDGCPVPTSATELLGPIAGAGKPLPLVFVNACLGGIPRQADTASLAEEILRAGVPCVLAMQTSVSDHYATALARAFYEHLARREPPLASRALAAARYDVEQARLAAVQRGAPLVETWPEYATATLYVAGEELPLADFAIEKIPLKERTVYTVTGPVPQLRIDDLIGRRRELRETLRALRDGTRAYAGVVLTGIGGVGKSAVAGRAMCRLAEGGWLVPAHRGAFDLGAIATALGEALGESKRADLKDRGRVLRDAETDDQLRIGLIARTLAEEPVVLVFDDFEQNLVEGGGAFRDPDVGTLLGHLARNARRGRLLVTSRYPIPGADEYLHRIPVGPLSVAETRKLILRLPSLRGRESREIAGVLRIVGGHPRMLEFLDGLLRRADEPRLARVTQKLRETLAKAKLDPDTLARDLDEGLQQVVLLGARDVLLGELLDIARGEGIEEVLLQAAASNLRVSPAGLAHMLANTPADLAPVDRALVRLADLSLVHRFPDGSAWVHRWTAEGLRQIGSETAYRERCNRAGRYRVWRVEHESHDLADAGEAIRNHLAGRDFDAATGVAGACFDALRRFQQVAQIAALAGELLETLPQEHANYAGVADAEAQAHLALGFTEQALRRYEELLVLRERLAKAEPDRADYQRDLSVSYNKIGDLYQALGRGDEARDAYMKSLAIAERLAKAEPDRADHQVDLVNSLVMTAMAEGTQGKTRLERARSILKRLKAEGRLGPAEEPKIADIERRLREL